MKPLLSISLLALLLTVAFIVFRVTSPLLTAKQTKINLAPKADSSTLEEKALIIHVTPNNFSIRYQSNDISGDNLEVLLKKYQPLISSNPEQTIMVKPDKNLSYTRLITVLSLLKEAGWNNVKIEPSH